MRCSTEIDGSSNRNGPLVFREGVWRYAMSGEEQRLWVRQVHDAFRAMCESPANPCHFARAVVRANAYRFAVYDDACAQATVNSMLRDLSSYADEYATLWNFSSFVAVFETPIVPSTDAATAFIAQLLNAVTLADTDDWSDLVSDDPASPDYRLSVASVDYFVIGFSPAPGKRARLFSKLMLVFNPGENFRKLEARKAKAKATEVIRRHDSELEPDGSPYELLSLHGESPEWTAYSASDHPDPIPPRPGRRVPKPDGEE